jgi:hypothetical protein
MQNLVATTDTQKQAKADLDKQITTIAKGINKIESAEVATLATLSNANTLITLPNLLATATGKVLVSYNTNTKTTEDGVLKSQSDILDSVYIGDAQAVIFNGQGLNIWNFSKGTNTADFFQNVPKTADLTGLVRYPTNGRVYTADAGAGQIVSYQISSTAISKPVVSVKDASIKDAKDIAIDGNIYILTSTGIKKYNAGKPAAFAFPNLSTPFSGKGKLYTDVKSKQLYTLDANGRIIITDKTGKLLKILESDQLKDASDFTVDEATKTIYILKSGSLLKLNFSL